MSDLGTVFYQYSTETSEFWWFGINKNGRFRYGLLCSTSFLARLDKNFSLFLADNILSSPSMQRNTNHVIRFGRTPMTHIIWKLSGPTTHRKIYHVPSSPQVFFFWNSPEMRHGDVILTLQWRHGSTCGHHAAVHFLSFPQVGTGMWDRITSHR